MMISKIIFGAILLLAVLLIIRACRSARGGECGGGCGSDCCGCNKKHKNNE